MLCSHAIVHTAPSTQYLDIYKQGFFLPAAMDEIGKENIKKIGLLKEKINDRR
jgi:hypothetical protein